MTKLRCFQSWQLDVLTLSKIVSHSNSAQDKRKRKHHKCEHFLELR